MTEGAIRLAPGTMYGSLSKMEKDGVIRFVKEEDKRKIYEITQLGLEILDIELDRIKRLYKITQEVI
jgi:DNA-binding PadR family transcriptional regulator